MKKSLILAGLLAFTMTSAMASAQPLCPPPEGKCPPPMEGKFQRPKPPSPEEMEARKAKFENKLQLTEEQKAKAKEIRMKGHEEIKPVFEKIKAKKMEIDAVRKSRIVVAEQEKKIEALKADIKVLRKQAHEMRIKNMQEFEAILTPKQKKILEKMKKEGRKNFKKHHHRGCTPPPPPAPPAD